MRRLTERKRIGVCEIVTALSIAVIIISILCSASLFLGPEKNIRELFARAYSTPYEEAKEFSYQLAYDAAESHYHVDNRAAITVNEVSKTANLEVLCVHDTQYVIRTSADSKDKTDAWLEVHGSGVYTVDLLHGDYIVDEEHNSVTVRVNEPKLDNMDIDEKETQILLFEQNGLRNLSYREGEQLYDAQIKEGYIKIRDELSSNTDYIHSARDSAERLITALVKEVNRGNEDLTVYVEFTKYPSEL